MARRRSSGLLLALLSAAACLQLSLQQSIPVTPKCAEGSAPVFLLQHNSTDGVQLRTHPTANFLDCSEYCSQANDCVGVEYANGVCHIIGAADVPYQSTAENAPLITKSCVKSERICASPFHFDVHEQKILVGFAREVVPADTIQVCLSACLNAFDTFGFECESVMYYPVDQECILNTEDRLDRPDLFVDEHDDTVIYLDNNCAGSQCYAPYVTQYVAVEGRQLKEELDRSFTDMELDACEELCTQRLTTTVNDFNCKSFMYNNETRTCILSDERSTPLGRGRLMEAKGFTYFEKKCFASPRTCRNVASFTRVPQMLLVGFAAFVMENVPSVTMCLDQCTNPPPETGEKFVCKSAMYYYNEQECILNAESRHSKPDLFIPEEEDFVVDYFDINCQLEKEVCPAGKELHSVKTLNSALPEGDGSIHLVGSTGGSVADCMNKCYGMSPEKCRSFNYDKDGSVCNLLYLDSKTTLRPQVKQGIDHYDLHCLGPAKGSSCLNKDGAIYSRYLYTKQPGLPAKEFSVVSLSKCLDLCSENEVCEGVNYNRRNGNCAVFEKVEGDGAKNEHVDFYKNLCRVKETDNGASSAANVPPEVHISTNRTITTAVNKSEGHINALKTTFKKSSVSIKAKDEHRRKEQQKAETAAAAAAAGTSADASLSVSNSGKKAPGGPPVLIPADAVHTICNYEGIKVQIKNQQPFSGIVFVKNKYDTCRVEVETSDSATLVIGLPTNFGMKPIVLNAAGEDKPAGNDTEKQQTGVPASATATEAEEPLSNNEVRRRREAERDCGLVDMDNGTYKTTVVVQTNNLGIPGLVTSMDQIYEISCDYSSMLGGKITAAANMTVHGPQPSLIQPRGKIELGNPVLMQMNSGSGGHQPVVQAKLGDILELRWEIMAMDEELDFFVRECTAEPGGSNGRSDEKLQLIENGCPTPAVSQKLIPGPIVVQSSAVKIAHLQAFRFDSSSSVRITCHLEICKGNCKATTCDLVEGQKESWGRKKRSDNAITEFETKRYKVPRFAQATTSVVVIDPLQQINEPAPSVSLSRQSPIDLAPEAEPPVLVERASIVGQMCMNKITLLGVLGTLLSLILIQAIIVTKYIFQRIFSDAKKASSSNFAY